MDEDRDKRKEALDWVGKAYQCQMRGDVEQAIEFYNRSMEVHPTAEALTFRGWARFAQRDFVQAIEDCHAAIDLDPEYGNPYNDIGAYYLELDEPDEAIPWLRMALKAKRYESYCYPHFNLGRIYENRGDLPRALEHYRSALQENPAYALAARAITRVQAKLAPRTPEAEPHS